MQIASALKSPSIHLLDDFPLPQNTTLVPTRGCAFLGTENRDSNQPKNHLLLQFDDGADKPESPEERAGPSRVLAGVHQSPPPLQSLARGSVLDRRPYLQLPDHVLNAITLRLRCQLTPMAEGGEEKRPRHAGVRVTLGRDVFCFYSPFRGGGQH